MIREIFIILLANLSILCLLKRLKRNIIMGSLDRGVLTGFICRLCSEMHKVVLHIYGEEGIRLCISEKINRYLSINVNEFFKLCFFDYLLQHICSTKFIMRRFCYCVNMLHRWPSFQVSRSDPLPKTICKNCLERLENQHRLVMRIEQAANMLKGQRRARVVRGCYVSLCDNNNGPPEPPIPK